MDYRLLKNIQWATASREAKLILASGIKGVGKSKGTLDFLQQVYVQGDIKNGIKPRKGLIVDFNDEYGEFGIKAIYPEHIAAFNIHPKCEICRIRPLLNQVGGYARPMNNTEKLEFLAFALSAFKGGGLLVEDPNKYAVRAMPDDVIGPLCANRHSDCDIIIHYQSTARPLPMVWENTSALRFYYQHDDVYDSKYKLGADSTELFKIAQFIVNHERFENNDDRYWVWIDKDRGKIISGAKDISKEQFEAAILKYITSKRSIMSPLLNEIDLEGKTKYTKAGAIQELQKQLYKKYWGN